MIKLNLTLGNTFFEQFYSVYSDKYGDTLPKICQHKITISDKILDYYERCAQQKGVKDLCVSYLQSMVSYGSKCEFVRDYEKDTIEEELIAVATDQKMKVLLAEKEEIKKAQNVNLYDIKHIKEKGNCILNLYSLPVTSRYIPPKKNAEAYKKWLQNWMIGEMNIIIRDKYLLNESGMMSFKNHFLPIIEKGAKIEIQTSEDVDERILKQFDTDPIFDDYAISIFKCENMHERVFIFDTFQIVIGKGVAFLSGDWNLTSESFISISEITIDAKPTRLSRIR